VHLRALADCRDAVTAVGLSARDVAPGITFTCSAPVGPLQPFHAAGRIDLRTGDPTDIEKSERDRYLQLGSLRHAGVHHPGPNQWPRPAGGNLITWNTIDRCQVGRTAVSGYFYLAPTPTNILQLCRARWTAAARWRLLQQRVQLGTSALVRSPSPPGAGTPGCNPCDSPCPGTPTPAYSAPACTPPPPPPPPREGLPKLLSTFMPVTSRNACAWGALAAPENAVTRGELATEVGPFYYTYLLAARREARPWPVCSAAFATTEIVPAPSTTATASTSSTGGSALPSSSDDR